MQAPQLYGVRDVSDLFSDGFQSFNLAEQLHFSDPACPVRHYPEHLHGFASIWQVGTGMVRGDIPSFISLCLVAVCSC